MYKKWPMEPWLIPGKVDGYEWPVILSGTGERIYSEGQVWPSRQMMERAVACVNACTHIPNPEGLTSLIDLCRRIDSGDYEDGDWEGDRETAITAIYDELEAAMRSCGIEVSREPSN